MRISRGSKRAALLAIVLMNFLVLPFSFGADPEVISASEAASLGLEIPASTPAGYQVVTIEVTDDAGNTTTRNIAFCQGADGKTYWNNVCPEVTPTPEPTETPTPEPAPVVDVPATIDALNPAPYDPISEPIKTANNIIAGFAGLAVMGAAGGAAAASSSNSSSNSSSDGPDSFESLESGELARAERRKEGRGDRSKSWRFPGTKWVDTSFDRWVERVSKFSPLLARVLMDNSYLQAMLGSLSVVLYPIAFVVGAYASHSVKDLPVPPSYGIVLIIVAIGILDSLAGLIAGARFFIGIAAAGNLHTRQDIFAMIATVALFFAPVLIASAFRPFRREVSDSDERWERATDFVLAVLVGSWATKKIVDGISGVGHKSYELGNHGTSLAWMVGIFLVLRLLLEEFALRWYPARLKITTPHLKSPSFNQQIISLGLKIDMFIFLAEPFIGANIYLWLATFLFGAPSLFHLYFEEKLPTSAKVHLIIPKGTVNVVVMVFVGTFFANFLHGQFESPSSFVKWSFVLLGIPSLLLGVLEWFADEEGAINWQASGARKFFYRVGGLVFAGLFILIVSGKDLPALASKIFH